MKRLKKTFVSITLALLLAVSTLLIASADSGTSYTAMTSVSVSFSEALTIVSDAYPDLMFLSLALDDENGVYSYQAELLNPMDGSVTEIVIDSESGQITTQTADDNNQNDQDENDGVEAQYTDSAQDELNADNENDSEENRNELEANYTFMDINAVTITFEQAQSILRSAYPGYTLLALGLEDENGVLTYQAALLNPADDSIAEATIDCQSGQIQPQVNEDGLDEADAQDGKNVQYEDKSDDNGNAEQSDTLEPSAVKVSFMQAFSIVSAAYPDHAFFALQLDSENGSLIYQAELFNRADGSVLEVKIDPVSGQILSEVSAVDEQNGHADETDRGMENDPENDN